MSLIRAVTGLPPSAEYVWNGDFRPDRKGGDTAPIVARRRGVQFSALERALDELNFARNRVVHGGARPNRAVGLTRLPSARPQTVPCVASMTSLNLLERMNELSDGVIRPFNSHEGGETWVHIGNPG